MKKYKVFLKGLPSFEIWNDNGKVCQSGWFFLPEVLMQYPTKLEAEIYIHAFREAMRIANEVVQ